MTTDAVAIAVAPEGATGALRGVIDRLLTSGIPVGIADDLPSAAELASKTPAAPPCVLIDLRSVDPESDLEDVMAATERIRRAVHAIPNTMPIAVTVDADAALVIACIRAGAGDVIDIQLEGTANARAVVQRIYQRQKDLADVTRTARSLRAMIEDLLKDLIRTERRSIDLEEKLAQWEGAGQTGEAPMLGDVRPPSILVIDADHEVARQVADRLSAQGITPYVHGSGEHAIVDVETLLSSGAGFDLALVAAQLPGIDGLEAVRRLRDRIAGLPAFLMTSVHDADLAARVADLGVVGFVLKPLADVDELVARLSQLAREALQRTREHLYLQRIKARHERVLERYRSLPR